MRALGMLVVLGMLVGRAQAADPSLADYNSARELYRRGTQQYRLTEFKQALATFTEAYRLVPQRAFLYNIAQCHRALGEEREALRFYRSYLGDTPATDPERPAIEAIVRELDQAIAKREETVTRERRLGLERELEAARAERISAELALRRSTRPPGTRRGARALMWSGVGVALVGLTAGLAGTAPALSARDARLTLQLADASFAQFDPQVEQRYRRSDLAAGLLFGVGGALALTGVTFFGVGLSRERRLAALGDPP